MKKIAVFLISAAMFFVSLSATAFAGEFDVTASLSGKSRLGTYYLTGKGVARATGWNDKDIESTVLSVYVYTGPDSNNLNQVFGEWAEAVGWGYAEISIDYEDILAKRANMMDADGWVYVFEGGQLRTYYDYDITFAYFNI